MRAWAEVLPVGDAALRKTALDREIRRAQTLSMNTAPFTFTRNPEEFT